MSKRVISGFGYSIDPVGAEINSLKKKTNETQVAFSYKPHLRFCETCASYKPRRGPAFKGWMCDDCKAHASGGGKA